MTGTVPRLFALLLSLPCRLRGSVSCINYDDRATDEYRDKDSPLWINRNARQFSSLGTSLLCKLSKVQALIR